MTLGAESVCTNDAIVKHLDTYPFCVGLILSHEVSTQDPWNNPPLPRATFKVNAPGMFQATLTEVELNFTHYATPVGK